MSLSDFIGSTVDFNTRAPGLLGANRKNVTISAILDLDTAMLLADVRAKHMQVKDIIEDLPASAGAYSYVKLTSASNGQVEILGIPWINEESISVVFEHDIVVTISNITNNSENIIRQALLQNGISSFTIDHVRR